ncbi:ribosome maturation protein RimM [Dehalococcoides mccartyi]|jgi:16S rRNA processing protein RimM|uniref:ribosome maturation factor RimM n=1 Tax=Dehalococcoides mccartyi TaxID=61435 RepID=UPI0004E09159|nr:ribosome maturation factor RimM [Dehalococcoides mccartyi]AII57708.1 ribosome maturation protein RimM [Dehalococcoides mccartyi CG1]APH12191.1 ribosome maturation protein RimM [Dehalococcoides mccartyi]
MAQEEYILIGKVLGIWGMNGGLKIGVLTDFPERFDIGNKLLIRRTAYTVSQTSWQKAQAVIHLSEITDIDAAEELIGAPVEIPFSALKKLPEGVYYDFQLIGLEVVGLSGEKIGQIKEILHMPSNDIYVISYGAKEALIPAVKDVVKEINLQTDKMIIDPIPGLLD